ncbi:MAG: hypothetical protein ACR2QO_18615 [Acidimicrobiales bacterium]
MDLVAEQLTMYGQPASVDGLDWAWVDEQLGDAAAYWTTTAGSGHPHPRPVWGIWLDHLLYLSVGSPTLAAELGVGCDVTVNLGSVTDVVVVEGRSVGPADEDNLIAAYNYKYDWNYTLEEYGPLTGIAPVKVMAWRSSGWAGRGGFESAGRWNLM